MIICVLLWLFASLAESRVETSFLIIHQEESLSTVYLYLAQTLRQLRGFLTSENAEVLILTSNHDMSEATLRGFLGEKEVEGSMRLFFESRQEMDSPPASKFNMLASYSKGDLLVFLNLRTVPHETADLERMLEKARDPEIGVVGCKVLDANDNIYSSGYEVILKEESEYSYDFDDEGEDHKLERDMNIIPRYRDYNSQYHLANRVTDVDAIALGLFVVKKREFHLAGGFNSTFRSQKLTEVHLCLTLSSEWGLRVVYFPEVVVTNYFYPDETRIEELDTTALNRLWNYSAREFFLTRHYESNEVAVVWSMDCGTGQVLGFTMEAINYILALYRRVLTLVSVNDIESCRESMQVLGLSEYVRDIISSLLSHSPMKRIPHTMLKIVVLHKDPGRYEYAKSQTGAHLRRDWHWRSPRPRYRNDPVPKDSLVVERATDSHHDEGDAQQIHEDNNESGEKKEHVEYYFVGRSMFETDRIPSDWLEVANDPDVVDEIWVPSEFNVGTFSKAGVKAEKLVKIPESIDVFHFDPHIYRKNSHIVAKLDSKENEIEKVQFLSVMKWESRKAWKELLTAYFDEFSGDDRDKIRLSILFKMSPSDFKEYEDFKHKYLQHAGVAVSSLPEVHFIAERISYLKLPLLYHSVDAFVSASHGEGWGLPLCEAMSMGLPTIASNWSGNTEFMNNNNSLLVAVEMGAANQVRWLS